MNSQKIIYHDANIKDKFESFINNLKISFQQWDESLSVAIGSLTTLFLKLKLW